MMRIITQPDACDEAGQMLREGEEELANNHLAFRGVIPALHDISSDAAIVERICFR